MHARARRQCRLTHECTFDRVVVGLFERFLDFFLAGEVRLGVVDRASARDENAAFSEELLNPSEGDDRVIDLATGVSMCFLCAMHATVRRQPGTPVGDEPYGSLRTLWAPVPRAASSLGRVLAPRGYPTGVLYVRHRADVPVQR
jgi:hypothetical protein